MAAGLFGLAGLAVVAGGVHNLWLLTTTPVSTQLEWALTLGATWVGLVAMFVSVWAAFPEVRP